MEIRFSDGMWPVMLTPFQNDGSIDYEALELLIDWYIEKGSSGLFAVCQSSEMFNLSLKERVELTKFIKRKSKGRVPVISSGHISYSLEDQIEELNEVANAGADAVIFISNRLARINESDDIMLENLKTIVSELPKELPLGFYECPYPYKRILSDKIVEYCAGSERFYFLKDTSCDIDNIRNKLNIIKGSCMKLFNANTSTLLESLKLGASGYSGVMANFHPELYSWLLNNWKIYPDKAEYLQDILTMCSFIELKNYPLNSKYYLKETGIPIQTVTRKNVNNTISETEISELHQLKQLSDIALKMIKKEE